MGKLDLHKEFMDVINGLSVKKSELIDLIAKELRIERESAYRRLSGRVMFSVSEIGTLARKLNISLDDILQDNPMYKTISVMMAQPMTRHRSIEVLADQMKSNLGKIRQSADSEKMELYSVFDSLPIEFLAPYPSLMKFMFFKWGYHYIGTDEFYCYKKWSVPEEIMQAGMELTEACKGYTKILYVWDYPMIWNLMNDISFFRNIHVLDDDDANEIKSELHELLYGIERVLQEGTGILSDTPVEMSFYFTTVNIGINCLAHISQTNCYSLIKSYFFQTETINNYETVGNVRDWIQSMKVLCVQISESSDWERRLFFKRQHKMLD